MLMSNCVWKFTVNDEVLFSFSIIVDCWLVVVVIQSAFQSVSFSYFVHCLVSYAMCCLFSPSSFLFASSAVNLLRFSALIYTKSTSKKKSLKIIVNPAVTYGKNKQFWFSGDCCQKGDTEWRGKNHAFHFTIAGRNGTLQLTHSLEFHLLIFNKIISSSQTPTHG